jgi:hypothetical protein
MPRAILVGLCLAVFLAPSTALAAEPDAMGFTPLFNGADLDEWVIVNVAPETFSVRDGMIVSTGVPTGVMRTQRMYENFELQLEWRHMVPQGNAGLFVWSDAVTAPGVPFTRSIEVQVLDGRNSETYTSHGDIFSIHGAVLTPDRPHPKGAMRCLPSEQRCKPSPEWNHYHVTCRDGVIKLAVNGKEVSGGSACRPRKGYICLESEGTECHFRNIRVKELPSSNPPPEEIATADEGFRALYTGLDLRGWRNDEGHEGHWQPKDWRLSYDGGSEASDPNLWTEREYGDFVMICDWRLTAKPEKKLRRVLLPSADFATNDDGSLKLAEIDDAGDSGIYLRGNAKSQVNIWCSPVGSGEVHGYVTDKQLPPEVRTALIPREAADKPPGQWNRFVITMKGDRVTVNLNGRTVIDDGLLPGVPPRGRIGLQHHRSPVEFANLYVREL